MNPKIESLIQNIEKVIIGKRDVVEKIVCAMLAEITERMRRKAL